MFADLMDKNTFQFSVCEDIFTLSYTEDTKLLQNKDTEYMSNK